jgi:succinoglycan biosynthesis transport protein ExoP
MDISYYLKLLRRWFWLILAVTGIGCILGFAFSQLSEPSYEANTLLSVGGYIQSPNPQATEVIAGVNLAQTYMVMATTRDVLQTAVDATGFPLTVQEIREEGVVSANLVTDTSILELTVTYSNPELAANLSNQIAQQLIRISPTDPRLGQSGRREVPSNYLQVVEWATTPNKPTGPAPLMLIILGGFFGGALAGGTILVLDYLDQSIKTAEEVNEAAIGTVLVTIPRYKKPSIVDHQDLIMSDNPNTPIADRFRALRTMMLYDKVSVEHPPLYVFTSPGPNEGKSFVSSNLATALAVADKRVLLIDADLRRPTLHEIFELENEKGLTDLLELEPPGKENGQSPKAHAEFVKFCQETEYKGLSILTSGSPHPNPAELLGSERAAQWFEPLRSFPDFDVILIDSPPSLICVDAFVIAAAAEGSIIMIMRSGKTRKPAAQELRMNLERLNLNLYGLILNDVPPSELGGYYRQSLEYYRLNPTQKD